jgi:biotin carboxylase
VASILVVQPTVRDEANLADESIRSRFRLVSGDPPAGDADPGAFLGHLIALGESSEVDGVFGSRDQSMHLAVRVADRLGLPGPSPEAFMRCHDKLASRRWQRRLVPDATPAFAALDPEAALGGGAPPLDYPFFLKPITGHLSQLAFPIHDPAQLASALDRIREGMEAVTRFDRGLEPGGYRLMLAEELLRGRQFTFEGFMKDGAMTTVGVTDSMMHPNGISFERFEYPSVLPAPVRAKMAAIAERLLRGIEFDGSLFNVEFFLTPDDRLRIIEVNGRMASQFGPLVRAVHGVSTFEVQLELVAGGVPELPPARDDIVAASFVLRSYVDDAVVGAVPDPAAVLDRYPHAQVELLVRPGQRLSENDDDVASHRLALVALAAPTREALLARFEEAKRLLPFELRPVEAPARAPGG